MVAAFDDCQKVQQRNPCPNKNVNLARAIVAGEVNIVFNGNIRRILNQHRKEVISQTLERLAVVSHHSKGPSNWRHRTRNHVVRPTVGVSSR